MANPEHLAIIKQGVEVWNHWRDDNPEIEPDLSQCCLKDLDLSKVMFNNTNLKKAILVDNNFTEAKFYKANLNQATLGRSIINKASLVETNLEKSELRETSLIACDLSRSNLFFANLHNADLTQANLFLTNLTKAILLDANLTQASLYCTQLAKTDLEEATLTGALIKDCNISSANLRNVICKYIYLQHNKKERRPHSRNFNSGEFSQLYQKIVKVVELYFNSGINWQAFWHSFQKLQIECNSEDLAIQAIENKFGRILVVRIEVPSNLNKAKIEKFIENEYKLKLKSIEEQYKLCLGMKDEQINIYRQHNTDLKEIIQLKASQSINQNNFMSNINQNHSGNGDNVGRDKNINNTNESPELIQIIQELQVLLEKLSQGHNLNNTGEKLAVATKAFETIKQDSSLAKRVLSALEKGGAAWLQAKLINPSASFLVAALEDWQKNKQ